MSDPYLPESSGREPSAAELATSRDPRVGIAYAVAVRSEGGGEHTVPAVIVTYRLSRRDPHGRELPVLQVEMRGRTLQGMIADGDLIQAPSPLPPAGVVQLETVTNLTTGAPVVLQQPMRSRGCLFGFVVVVLLIVVAGVIGFFAVALGG